MMDPPGIAVSGWIWRGPPFIRPPIDAAIELAVTLKCCTAQARYDQGIPGRFYACHAERQHFMKWLEVNEVVVNMNSEVMKVFACDTSIKLCKDCVRFFHCAAEYFKVQVVLNSDRYGPP